MAKKQEFKGIPPRKLELGEVIEFSDIAITSAITQYGETSVVNFADKDGKVFRKCFAQGGMLEWLNKNPDAKTIVLKKKLVDGELSYNVWDRSL